MQDGNARRRDCHAALAMTQFVGFIVNHFQNLFSFFNTELLFESFEHP
jgi:hypothetical protein